MKQLQHDIDNVKNEAKANIITIKKILIREKIINEDNFELLSKYSPVMFFSIWEGFFKESIKSYFGFFNRNKNFKRDLLMLTSISEHHNIIADNYSRFDSKKNLLSHIQNLFEKPEFEVKRPHINPTSFNDMNTFLKRIKINPINKKSRFKYNSLAYFRNKCAHWDDMPPISQKDIEDYINLVYDLMFELEENILKSATLNLNQNSI